MVRSVFFFLLTSVFAVTRATPLAMRQVQEITIPLTVTTEPEPVPAFVDSLVLPTPEPVNTPFPSVSPTLLTFRTPLLEVRAEPTFVPSTIPDIAPTPTSTPSPLPSIESAAVPTIEPTPVSTLGSTFGVQNATDGGPFEVTPETTKAPLNEGCVAVEHLAGYVLQHKEHLWRRVLCANDFCATPNHAIIVDGISTSMKRLCADEWQCVESVKLVNNLDIFANRRAVVSSRITVTPYDLRFPKLLVWVAQAAERLWTQMHVALASFALLSTVFIVRSRTL